MDDQSKEGQQKSSSNIPVGKLIGKATGVDPSELQNAIKGKSKQAAKQIAKKMAKEVAKKALQKAAVYAAAATSEFWVPALLIALLFAAFLVLISAIGSTVAGSSDIAPVCDGLSASADTSSQLTPVMLTLDNCSDSGIIVWNTPSIGGSFRNSSPNTDFSNVYTPPSVTTPQTINIQVDACSSTNQSVCNHYSVQITVTASDCATLGGSCAASCSTTQAGSCSTAGEVCCYNGASGPNPSPSGFHFFCQYDSDYQKSGCSIAGNGCTPTSVAMSIYSLGHTKLGNGKATNPYNVAIASGGHGCTSGSNPFDFKTVMINAGVNPQLGTNIVNYMSTPNASNFNYTLAKRKLAAGCYLLSGADQTWGTSSGEAYGGGHATLLSAIGTVNGYSNVITMRDPTFCTSDTNGRPRYVRTDGKNAYNLNDQIVRKWWTVYAVCP